MSTLDWGLTFRAAEPDDRGMALVLAIGALAAAALIPFVPWLAPLLPPCPFHALTGLPCPGCGTTRAALALARGDVAAALGWNPLAAGVFVLGGVSCLIAPWWVASERPLPSLAPVLPRRARLALVAALGANWAWLLVRGV